MLIEDAGASSGFNRTRPKPLAQTANRKYGWSLRAFCLIHSHLHRLFPLARALTPEQTLAPIISKFPRTKSIATSSLGPTLFPPLRVAIHRPHLLHREIRKQQRRVLRDSSLTMRFSIMLLRCRPGVKV